MFLLQQYLHADILREFRPLLNGSLTPGSSSTTGLKSSILPEALSSLPLPPEVTSLISRLSSVSALQNWLLLAAIGWLFSLSQQVFWWLKSQFFKLRMTIWNRIVEYLYITVEFGSDEPCYKWMTHWLAQQSEYSNGSRTIRFSRGLSSVSADILGPFSREDSQVIRDLRILPMGNLTYSCWFKKHYLTVGQTGNTVILQTPYYPGSRRTHYDYEEVEGPGTLQIRILARDPSIVLDLLREAQKAYAATHVHTIKIRKYSQNNWTHAATVPKRSFQSIVLEPAIKDLLIKDATNFLGSKTWYSDRCIPFRRGYLLYGPPGSGKTSFISAIASELGLDIYTISLYQATDSGLTDMFNTLPGHCIAVIEDIDAAFTTSLNRDTRSAPSMPADTGSRISLSSLLNALDGLGAQEGRILFATTNEYDALDKALTRPGRMDLHVEFKLAAKYQARELFMRFYDPTHALQSATDTEDETGSDSGYSTSSEAPLPSSVALAGNFHWDTIKAPQLSWRRLQELADAFADSIPEHKISMANLQGYLIGYKTDPAAAVGEVKAWVQETIVEAQKVDDYNVPPPRNYNSYGHESAWSRTPPREFRSRSWPAAAYSPVSPSYYRDDGGYY